MKKRRHDGWAIFLYIVAGIIAFPIVSMAVTCLLVFGYSFFDDSDMPNYIVQQIVESPDAEYQIEIVTSSQGALGGATDIYLVNTDQDQLSVVGEPRCSKGERVASCNWMDHQRMKIQWLDSKEFRIIIDYDNSDQINCKKIDFSSGEIVASDWYIQEKNTDEVKKP